jgi:DNA-directed RNA polymerase subunit E'/Rpb7
MAEIQEVVSKGSGEGGIFFKSIVSERVKLKPSELHRDYKDVILHKLREGCEGRCTRNGYVRRNSIELHKVSPGRIEMSSLNGDVTFVVLYQCDICNPAKGDLLTAVVVNTNKLGILAHSGTVVDTGVDDHTSGERITKFVPVLQVMIPHQIFDSDVSLEDVSIGDIIGVEVLGKKFNLNDKKIRVTCRATSHERRSDNTSNLVFPFGSSTTTATKYLVDDVDELKDGTEEDDDPHLYNELAKDEYDDDDEEANEEEANGETEDDDGKKKKRRQRETTDPGDQTRRRKADKGGSDDDEYNEEEDNEEDDSDDEDNGLYEDDEEDDDEDDVSTAGKKADARRGAKRKHQHPEPNSGNGGGKINKPGPPTSAPTIGDRGGEPTKGGGESSDEEYGLDNASVRTGGGDDVVSTDGDSFM